MKVVAAFLLARLAGNDSPSASDIEGIINAVGGTADADAIQRLLSALEGKDLDEVLAEGMGKLVNIGGGGGGGGAAAGGAGEEAAVEEEEEEEEEESESIGGGAGGLFGDSSSS